MNNSTGKKQNRGGARGLGAVFGSIRIGTRLTFAFVVVLALLVAGVFMGLRGLNEVYTAAQGAFAQNVQVSRHASEITILALNERRFEKDMFINVADAAKVDSYKQKWVATRASMDKEIDAVRAMTLSTEDKAAVEQIAAGHKTYAEGVLSVAGRLGTSIRTTQDANAAMGDFKAAVHGLEEGSKALNERAISGVEGIDESLAATQKKTKESQWTLAAVSLALGLLFCVLITRSITKPLRNALDVSKAIAAGRFDNQIDARSKDETGELLASLGVMQERLLESELNAKGQLAMIGQMQAVAEYSPDGKLQQANENFQRIMGYSLDAMVGQPHSKFVDGPTRTSGAYQQFWQRLQQGHAEAGQFRRIRADGTEVWMQGMYGPIVGADGKPFKVVCYLTDVTEEIRAAVLNAAFKGALNQLDANVMVADNDAKIIFVNPATTRMLTSAQSDLRKELSGFDAVQLVGARMDVMTREPAALRSEIERLQGTGTREEVVGGRIMKAIMSPMKDEGGRRLGTVIEWFDRTQEVATERELQGIIAAVTAGDLDKRIALEGKTGIFESLSRGINSLVDNVDVLAREIQTLVTVANAGDLTKRIQTEGKAGLLVKLGSGVNKLTDNMAAVVSQVKQAAAGVSRGADEISQGNTNLSQRTEEQASSLEETASSMEEMTSTVKQNADNANQASQLAVAARDQAEKGGTVVARAVAAMTDINDASKKIADIIGVIDEIAFQTNLLALNAAVEAARAGEQGRGFAVVATEVRNLAGRSATAAKEIKALIQDSVRKVDEGSNLVTQSGTTLEQLVVAVKKVADIVAEIAAASNEQSAGIEQVNKAVMQLDELTQQNAALVEEASAASQSMAEQARVLNESMTRYKVADDMQPASGKRAGRLAGVAAAA